MKSSPPPGLEVHRIAMAFFAVAGAVPCLMLLAWRLGWPGTGLFDLAASLVVLLLGLSVAGWLCQRRSESVVVNRVGWLMALGSLAMSSLYVWQNFFGFRWPVEEWLDGALTVAGSTSRVHMNVESAFGCLFASLACLFGFRSWVRGRLMRQMAAVPALAVLILGQVVILCYLLQSPFFEHTTLLTGAELSMLGLGLLLAAGFDVWPLSLLFQALPEAAWRRRRVWGALSLVLLLGVTVLVTRLYYFTSQKSLAIRAAQKGLSTIADLKAAQITDWRNERLADADYLHHTPYITRRALEVLAFPRLAKTEEMLRDGWKPCLPKKRMSKCSCWTRT